MASLLHNMKSSVTTFANMVKTSLGTSGHRALRSFLPSAARVASHAQEWRLDLFAYCVMVFARRKDFMSTSVTGAADRVALNNQLVFAITINVRRRGFGHGTIFPVVANVGHVASFMNSTHVIADVGLARCKA